MNTKNTLWVNVVGGTILCLCLGSIYFIEGAHNSYRVKIKKEPLVQLEQRPDEKVVTEALTYLKEKEGFRATPYRCSAGAKTIGYGDTSYTKNFPEVEIITEEEASRILRAKIFDIQKFLKESKIQIGLEERNYVQFLSISQQVALISFVYNLGETAFRNSALKRNIDRKIKLEININKGYSKNPKYTERLKKDLAYVEILIKKEFGKWSKIKSGKTYVKLNSLERRREEEARMFLASN